MIQAEIYLEAVLREEKKGNVNKTEMSKKVQKISTMYDYP
jgi:hypothetical protein